MYLTSMHGADRDNKRGPCDTMMELEKAMSRKGELQNGQNAKNVARGVCERILAQSGCIFREQGLESHGWRQCISTELPLAG